MFSSKNFYRIFNLSSPSERIAHCFISREMSSLQVVRATSKAEVRKVYLAKVKLLHPDVYRGDENSTELTARLNLAYEKILEMYRTGELTGKAQLAPSRQRWMESIKPTFMGLSRGTGDA